MHVAEVVEILIDIDNFVRRCESVIGSDENAAIFTDEVQRATEELVCLAKILVAQIDYVGFPSSGMLRHKRRIEIAIGQMLQLIDAVEDDGREIAGLVEHEIFER